MMKMGHLLYEIANKAKKGEYTTYSVEFGCIAQLCEMGSFDRYFKYLSGDTNNLSETFREAEANEMNEKNMRRFAGTIATAIEKVTKETAEKTA